MKLTVQNAEIQTATVEVRTLTISGKQVTLAVFRQLVEKPWLDQEGREFGPAWGTVNYHPDRCADSLAHQHVIWQEGTDLRRWHMRQPGATWGFLTDESAYSLVEILWCIDGHGSLESWTSKNRWVPPNWMKINYRGSGECVAEFSVGGVNFRANVPIGPGHECPEDTKARRDECLKELRRVGRAELDRRTRWQAAYESVGPQLFIAV